MDLKVYTRKRKKKNRAHQQTFELPDEIVYEILIRLPVESLARFKSVSKAWHDIISDPSFVLAHLQCSKERQHRNPSSLLVTPQVLSERDPVVGASSTNIRFYRWSFQDEDTKGTATLVYERRFPTTEFKKLSQMAHCDGLMLMPTNTKAYIFNPATRDVIALPQSQHKHDDECLPVGLGLDTSTGKYKVARCFYRSCSSDDSGMVAMGMEVFTIDNGEEDSWRETLADLPYPVWRPQNATHYKGHLLYFMDRENNQHPPKGLLRFSLVDETFGVTPLPICLYDMVEDDGEEVYLNELGGELCATVFMEALQLVMVFTASDVLNPVWGFHYEMHLENQYIPLAFPASGRVLVRGGNDVIDFDLEYDVPRGDRVDMYDIRYLGPNEDILGHEWKKVRWFDITSYTESLVPVTQASLRRRAL